MVGIPSFPQWCLRRTKSDVLFLNGAHEEPLPIVLPVSQRLTDVFRSRPAFSRSIRSVTKDGIRGDDEERLDGILGDDEKRPG